ncbi:MAG: GTPase RsgA [Candidatus Diapherotrites archaeon]|jgi:ribosome biogenesis GTPase A|uniref:GTPase RsgA n=1 Tax=Candidatus Iainarchaeum sp. TaxID=3101447 RepID=A0A8T5GG76_9ARCH|nr:GTPase RsgA [Candidatus Diapherotrites archaeon]MBT7241726.1 GTPase RsgA [Candidatus Diapherotrites archaeon]
MSKGFMKQIMELIYESDIVLEILDARFPDRTRNKQIEERIISKGKKLILVLNKTDLAGKEKIKLEKKELIEKEKLRVVFVSAKEKNGIRLLKRELSIASKGKKELIIGMLGYPNSGKSTLINALSGKGKGKVRTSKRAGFTRGLQRIKISEGIYLIDAPGIIPYGETDEFELFLVGAKNANQLKDMETVALKLISEMKEKFQEMFSTKEDDEETILEEIAMQKKWVMRGGKADMQKAAREVLEMYQRNKL